MTAATARALLNARDLLAAAVPGDLSTAEALRRRWPASLVAAATEQVELRARARSKFTMADAMLFTRAGLEQSTGEPVARHRARRYAGVTGTVADLCCGIGGDLVALAQVARAVGVDRDETHAFLARHNARAYGADAPVAVGAVEHMRLVGVSAVFVDPARRNRERRGGSSPPLEWCFGLPVARVCVKAAPGVDLRDVPDGWEAEFVADGRDLKEAALWSPAWSTAARRATVLPGGDSILTDPATPPAPVKPPGRYLLDPSPAVTRAGAVADVAQLVHGWQIDRRIAFLCADQPTATPFGRWLQVEADLPFALKPLKAALRRLDVGAVAVRRRGLAGDVEDLARRLRGRGSRAATVVLTRVVDRPWAFVCTDVART